MAVNAGLGVLDVQLALGLDDDVVPAGNANTAVLVRFTVFPTCEPSMVRKNHRPA